MGVVRFAGRDGVSHAVHVVLILASIFAGVSFAVFANKLYPPGGSTPPPPGYSWSLGAGFGLTVASCILCLGDVALWHSAATRQTTTTTS